MGAARFLEVQGGASGQPFRRLSLTWDGDLNDIQVLWLNFDGPQPTQLPGGSCEEGQETQSDADTSLAGQGESFPNILMSVTC